MSKEPMSAGLQQRIEAERAAIAREVHDELGGALAALRYDLAWIRRHTDDASVHERIEEAARTLALAIGTGQRIVSRLRPPDLDQGLVPALEALCAAFEKRTGIVASFTASNDSIEAPEPALIAVFRTAQEALTNAGKHSSCSRVTMRLDKTSTSLELLVSDDGQGLAAANETREKPKGSFGLKGLHERARSVGGTFEIVNHESGAESHGVTLRLSVPVPNADAPLAEVAR